MKAKFKSLKRRTVQKVMGGKKGKDGESAVPVDAEFDDLVRGSCQRSGNHGCPARIYFCYLLTRA